MAENLIISDGTKEQKYQTLLQQVIALAENESDTIALMANISSMIHHTFGFFWTGLYRVSGMYKDKVRTRRLRDIMEEGRVTAVLDIDSDKTDTFDETDKEWLEKICGMIAG